MLAPGKVLKAEKWWNDKAPPVFGLAYYLLATGAKVVPLGRSLLAMAAFMTAFIGVAGYGHIVNDLGDIEVDRAAQKANTMQGRKGLHSALMIAALLAMAWLPWLLLPANRWNLSLIGIQLLLLTVYTAPPLRLKARPVLGVITDALYAYSVPMLITWTTWRQLGGQAKPQSILLAALIAWSFCAGLKGILVHQDQDAANDGAVGLSTFVTRYGHVRTFWLLGRIVVPTEMACFALMTLALARELRFYLVFVVLFFCWRVFQLAYLWDIPVEVPWRLPSEQAVTVYGYQFLGEFYTAWFPVFMLAALCFRSPVCLILACIHLALFRTGVVHFFRHDLKSIPWGISKMRQQRRV
jgi:4-hydroxybenzoate polyprenyltransferase